MIDELPDETVRALETIVLQLQTTEDYWKPVIEPANAEEIAINATAMVEYEKDPTTFSPLSEVRARLA
jgi:hypothetical protein